jgi:RNA ligase (TIGR02306 family)
MERKLASIQRVVSVESIPGADFIERIQVLGWRLVAKKGDFKPGDLCVYFEIDSVLPPAPEFEFLRERKFRIRTVKLRGAVSQGLAMPLSMVTDRDGTSLQEIADENEVLFDVVGDDMTELIGVTKYEPPVSVNLSGLTLGPFPAHLIPKTDEQRLQSFPGVLDEIADTSVYTTVKLEGTSATYYLAPDGHFGVCSRNLELKPDLANIFWQLAEKYEIEATLRKLAEKGMHYAIQGEACGPKISGNRMGLKEHRLFVFNLYDIDQQDDVIPSFIGGQSLSFFGKLEGVPLIEFLTPEQQPKTVDEWLAYADRKDAEGRPIEGVVVRPMGGSAWSPTLQGRLSFKVVNNAYLLAHGD